MRPFTKRELSGSPAGAEQVKTEDYDQSQHEPAPQPVPPTPAVEAGTAALAHQ